MVELVANELLYIEGGKNWWYIFGGGLVTVAGVAGVAVSPTIGGKIYGGAAAIGGIATVVDGWNS